MEQRLPFRFFIALLFLLLGGCATPAATPTPPAPSLTPLPPTTVLLSPTPIPSTGAPASPASVPSPTPDLGHRIGVRVVAGVGEFYDRLTGEKFVPRGFNYVRVAPMSATKPGLWHATLNPGLYEPERAEIALQGMQAAGYNVVRVFVDCCREGSNAGDPKGGVSLAYLTNVVDFLNKAKAHKIYVLLVLDLTPAQGGYDEMWSYCCTTFDGENLRYLTPGGHTGERRFDRDFIQALIENDAPLDAIFAFDLTNEVHYSVDKPPLSLSLGRVTTANQKTYNMANPEDKQRMMDENLIYWIDQMRANILEVDPTALVTVSFPAINVGATTVNPLPAILKSTADFIDLHVYLGWGPDLEQYMQRFGVDGPTEKPLILGEFGADRGSSATAELAAHELVNLQAESCRYGFDGWLLWTWDTEDQETLWHGLSENRAISAALSPNKRPDPCGPAALLPEEELLAFPAEVLAEFTYLPAPVVRSGWTSYSSGNGIRDLALDQEGNLWAATSGGAVVWRGDGTYSKYTWEHGLAGNSFQTVVVAPDGAVWFGGYGGVSRFDGETWQTYTALDAFVDNYVVSSAAAADGSLWFGTTWSGTVRFDGETWQTYSYGRTPGFAAVGAIIDIATAPDGMVWIIGYDGGIVRFDGQEWRTFEDVDGMSPDSLYYTLAMSENGLWAGEVTANREVGLTHFDGETWRNYTFSGSYVPRGIQATAVSRDGTVWLSTRDGLFTFDGENWKTYGLQGVSSILADVSGALWLGTDSQGILKFDGQTAVAFVTDDYLDPYGVKSISITPAGDIWFGGLGGVAHLDGESWRLFTSQDGLADDNAHTIVVAPGGAVWVGTQGGASRFFNGEWTTYTTSNSGLAHNEVMSIAVDQLGATWFATLGGVSRFDGEVWQTYTMADGLASNNIYSVVADVLDGIWVATNEGVSRFDGQTWATYTGEDGLWNINAASLTLSPDGTIWLGRINGLAYFDGEEWVSISIGDREADLESLDAPSIGSIAFTPDGNLWCSLRSIGNHPSYGVGRFDGREWKIYSTADGLGDVEVNAIAVAPDGAVWFGTLAGVSRLLPP